LAPRRARSEFFCDHPKKVARGAGREKRPPHPRPLSRKWRGAKELGEAAAAVGFFRSRPPDLGRPTFLASTPKKSFLAPQKSQKSPAHECGGGVWSWGKENCRGLDLAGGGRKKCTRRDSNPQPSVPKSGRALRRKAIKPLWAIVFSPCYRPLHFVANVLNRSQKMVVFEALVVKVVVLRELDLSLSPNLPRVSCTLRRYPRPRDEARILEVNNRAARAVIRGTSLSGQKPFIGSIRKEESDGFKAHNGEIMSELRPSLLKIGRFHGRLNW
jgi:hypothetical protein